MLANRRSALVLMLAFVHGLGTTCCIFDFNLTKGDQGGTGGSSGGSGGTHDASGGSTSGAGGVAGGVGGSTGVGGSSGTGGVGGASGSGGIGMGGVAGSGGVGGSGGSAGSGGGCLLPEGVVCDPVSQCGCDSGENCHFDLGGPERTRACFPVGEVGPDSPCDSDVECVLAHGCVDGVCKQYCHTADDCSGEFFECRPFEIDGEPAHPDWKFCERHCDVISPHDPAPGYDACAADTACIPLFDTPTSATSTSCQAPGEGDAGEACSKDDSPACGPGLRCEFGQCLPWCDLAQGDCPGDLPCVAYPFPTGLRVAGRELGVCFDGVLAQDDFSDAHSGWWTYRSVRPLSEAVYLDGEFYMSSRSHAFTRFVSSPPYNGADMVVEVDTADWGGKAIVGCRNYWFQMNSSGHARIAVENPDYNPCLFCLYYDPYDDDYCEEYYECDAGSVSDVGLSEWVATGAMRAKSHITASCIGNSPVTLTLYINGQLVLEFEESVHNYTTGWPGLGVTDHGYAFFDNFFVWEP